MMWHAYSSFLYSFPMSSSVWMGYCIHSMMAFTYFSLLSSGRNTLFFSKFHESLANVMILLKGMSFDFSHGIPSRVVTSCISSKPYGYVFPCSFQSQMCQMGKVRSLVKFSAPVSCSISPLYCRCLPVCSSPPF